MKKYITLNLVIIISVLFGCEALDVSPTDTVTEDSYWQRASDAEIAVNSVYAELDGRGLFSLDNRTDIAFAQLVPLNPSDATVEDYWNRYFRGIRKANDIIANIGNVDFGDTDLLERVEAETRFLRAYYYTQLTSLWGDVPFIVEPIGINEHVARTSREEIVDFIITELDDVINSEALPQSYSGSDIGRATLGAAKALKARAALRNERWTVARDAAESVIESGVYELYPDYEGLFQYEGQNSSEVIFDRQYAANGDNFDAFGISAASIGGNSTIGPTHKLYEKYRLDDSDYEVSEFDNLEEAYENMDPRWAYNVYYTGQPIGNNIYNSSPNSPTPDRIDGTERATETGYDTKKYIDYENDISSPSTGSINAILIRYADVLLMYAEAKIQLGEIDQSVYDAINQVRERPTVDLEPISQATHPDQSALMNYLMDERAREFALEGLRLFDIMRWGIGDEAVAGPVYGAIYERPNGEVYVRDINFAKSFNENNHLWPIPQSEINSNTEISENNPGY